MDVLLRFELSSTLGWVSNLANDPQVADPQAPAPEAVISNLVYETTSNRLKTMDGSAVSHDAEGNITSLPQTGQPTLTMSYDAVNRLSTVSKDGSLQASYVYNAQGQRVLKQLNTGDSVVYHYNPAGQVIGETVYKTGLISAQKTYVWLGTMPLAMVDDGQMSYLHNDQLNTPRIATNQNKTSVWQWQSDAFGASLGAEVANDDVDGDGQSVVVNLRFPGQIFDSESGKHYNYFRDYDPQTGRYIQSDPIGLNGGLNTYAYVGGNPVNYVDPLGLFQFGQRPLEAFPVTMPRTDGNFSFYHEQGFYQDGSGDNVGFFGNDSNGRVGRDTGYPGNAKDYDLYPKRYDDSVMREAQKMVDSGDYDLRSNNCQDYADKLRDAYRDIMNKRYPVSPFGPSVSFF